MSRAGWIRFLVVSALVGALELASRMAWINPVSFIPPSRMFAAAYRILVSGKYGGDMVMTLKSVTWALLLAVAVGFAGGVALFKLPRLRRAVDPLLTSYYAVPIFVFYPLFVVLFGLNRIPLIVTGFLFALVAMVLSTLNGLERIPQVLLKTARVHRLSRREELRFVILPAALPYLFTGIKLAIAYALIAVIAGEFILSGAGFGYQIAFAYNNFDNPTMYGLMLLLLVFVGAVNTLLHAAEQRLYRRRGSRVGG